MGNKRIKATRQRDSKGRFKSWGNSGNDIWTPIGSSTFGSGYSDVYGSQPAPSMVDLLNAYEDTVYACVNLIAHNVSNVDYRLCATTGRGEDAPRCLTKSLPYSSRRSIEKNFRQWTRKANEVAEVADHPLLDLLDKPNPNQSFHKLLNLTQTYLELVGSAFWYLAKNSLGMVSEIWLLPSHHVQIVTDDHNRVTGYVNGYGDKEEVLSPDDVLHIKFANPLDPYAGYGLSPVRAVWQRVMLLRQEQSSWQAVLSNMAFPSALVYPPEKDGTFTNDQAERIARQITERFRMGEQGGVWVVQDNIQYTPIATPPKDLSALQIYDGVKTSVCNAYMVPRPLLDMQDANFASSDTARRAFQEYCIEPRVRLILEAVTHRLCPPRLFLAADDVIQADRTYELQNRSQVVQEVAGNLRTVNEGREVLGLEPIPGGEKFAYQIPPAFGPAFAEVPTDQDEEATPATNPTPQTAPSGPASSSPVPATGTENVQDTALNGAQITSLLLLTDKLAAREYPADAVVALIRVSFPNIPEDKVREIAASLANAPPPATAPAASPPVDGTKDVDTTEKAVGAAKGYTSTFPDPEPLAKALGEFFQRQAGRVSVSLKTGPEVQTKAFVPLADWTGDMKKSLSPILRAFFDQGTDSVFAALGGDDAMKLHAVQELDKAVNASVLALAQSTLSTTDDTIANAVNSLREAIRGGLSEGEADAQLAGRVKEIFTDLSERHARTIAETESTRAKHNGELIAIKAAGVACRKKWLPDSMACDICRTIAAKGSVELDKAFAKIGDGPYSVVAHPPAHPSCRCTMTYDFPELAV